MTIRLILAAGLIAAATPVLADEAWTTTFGDVIYEADVGDTAVLLVDDPSDRGRLYFPGLAGNSSDRSTHFGYWIAEDEGTCDAALTGIDGMKSSTWGSAIITFDVASFPTGWTATLGKCFGAPETGIRAEIR
ncbi:MAG: hypothetical protein GY717_08065 [Rhodobacteraceae bacterium]|nr:hypothetical protein [Paracoccaceae bacterium]